MDLIIDANALIYLCKTNLFQRFITLSPSIRIDTSVYKEVVEDGIKNNHPDAFIAMKFLEDYKIPVTPTDITNTLKFFRDPGETSCFLLAQQGGICITTDNRARIKMKYFGVDTLQLDEFFFNMALKKKIPIHELEAILSKLEQVYATTSSRSRIFINELKKEIEKNE